MIAVYALSNIDCPDDIYVGSSKGVKQRMRRHKSNCNKIDGVNYNIKVYQFIRSHGGWDAWKYHIIEEFDVYDKAELKIRENYWCRELKSTLNTFRVIPTKEELKKRMEKYYENNKADINNNKKQKYTCECGTTLRKDDKSRHNKTKKHQSFINSN